MKKPEITCSFCDKTSSALLPVKNRGSGGTDRICASCARGLADAHTEMKLSVPGAKDWLFDAWRAPRRRGEGLPTTVSFTKETAHDVLTPVCHALALEASIECEQLVGDVIFGGGTLAQQRLFERLKVIQCRWRQRSHLTSVMGEAMVATYDAVPELVAQANKILSADPESGGVVFEELWDPPSVDKVALEIELLSIGNSYRNPAGGGGIESLLKQVRHRFGGNKEDQGSFLGRGAAVMKHELSHPEADAGSGFMQGRSGSFAEAVAKSKKASSIQFGQAPEGFSASMVYYKARAASRPTLPPYQSSRDAHGFGLCEFCGCNTNANIRRCCAAGEASDQRAESKVWEGTTK